MLKPLSIIYDGQCGFCMRVLKVVRALDVRGKLAFHDSHQAETLARFPMLSTVNLDEAMYTVAEGESPYQGFFAFRRLIWASPLLWPFIPLFYFPGAHLLGPRLYAWVARNRGRLGCGTEICALPETQQEK